MESTTDSRTWTTEEVKEAVNGAMKRTQATILTALGLTQEAWGRAQAGDLSAGEVVLIDRSIELYEPMVKALELAMYELAIAILGTPEQRAIAERAREALLAEMANERPKLIKKYEAKFGTEKQRIDQSEEKQPA